MSSNPSAARVAAPFSVQELQNNIRQRHQLQQQRNALLQEFSGLDPQKLANPAALMGLLPKLPDLKAAFELTQKIEVLSDQIIAGFLRLNASGEGQGDG